MNAHTRKKLNLPHMGNRSREYIGINRYFDASWFPLTSSCCAYETRDPRIEGVDRQFHLAAKKELFDYGRKFEVPETEMKKQWRMLIEEGTKIATMASGFPQVEIPIKKSVENVARVKEALEIAEKAVVGEIHGLKKSRQEWAFYQDRPLDLFFDQSKKRHKRYVPLSVRWEVLKRDSFACCKCGAKKDDGAILEVDHVVAIANGGSNDPANLQTLCFQCNRGKGKKNA